MRFNRQEVINIYKMMCYDMDSMSYMTEVYSSTEECAGVDNILAAMFAETYSNVMNGNSLKEYREVEIHTDKLRGKLDIVKSVKTGAYSKGKLVCRYNTLGLDRKLGRIIKLAARLLKNSDEFEDYSEDIRHTLNKCMDYLAEVSDIQVDKDTVVTPDIDHSHEWLRPLVNVSMLVIQQELAFDTSREKMMLALTDEDKVSYIFERFIRGYARRLFKKTANVRVSRPRYRVAGNTSAWNILDVMVQSESKVEIIDAKCYSRAMRQGDNERQVCDYAGSFINDNMGKVYGDIACILIYVRARGIGNGEMHYRGAGVNRVPIYTYTIDLKQDFEKIKESLSSIIYKHLGC